MVSIQKGKPHIFSQFYDIGSNEAQKKKTFLQRARNVTLTFTVNEPASWMTYSFDGQDNVTIYGNMTLPELSHGPHNLTLYAKDTTGNVGASETIHFSIEPFPTTLIIAPIA